MIKKIVPYMLIALIVVQLFALFTVGLGVKKAEAGSACAIESVIFRPNQGTNVSPQNTILDITTSGGCKDNFLLGNITNTEYTEVLNFGLKSITADKIQIGLNVGEKYCPDPAKRDCVILYNLVILGEKGLGNAGTKIDILSKKSSVISADGIGYLDGQTFNYKCSSATCGTTSWGLDSSKTNGVSPYTDFSINTQVNSKAIKVYGMGPLDYKLNGVSLQKTDKLTISAYKVGDTTNTVVSETKPPVEIGDLLNLGGISAKLENAVIYADELAGLESETAYSIKIKINDVVVKEDNSPLIKTLAAGQQNFVAGPKTEASNAKSEATNIGDVMPSCNILYSSTWLGCIGKVVYLAVFKPTSALFSVTGKILDAAVGYSVRDDSYRSPFVVEGWKIIKDFCNMFFIFILLYIAIGTILNLSSVNTKQMIINVVIIGLLINFSLFATQVLIDTSNILTRLFYNQKTIVVGDGTPGPNGGIRLSEAIVTKIGPQKIIIDASKVDMGSDTDTANQTSKGISGSTFLLVVILASMVNIVGIVVFLSTGVIFIARVIGLWLAMIFSPMAFFSYIVPSLQDMKMVGWKHWWPDTIKMAFLAPVFVFFMYLIVKFLGIMAVSTFDANSKTGLDFLVAIIVPFMLVMILMWKAKSIAADMSGEIGAMATKAGAAVGGLALGAATGGVAMMGRGLIGGAGNALDKSAWVNKMAGSKNMFAKFAGNKLKDVGQSTAKSSFDFRNTKAGAAAGKGMGVDMGKGKTGGYVKDREEHVKRKQQRASEIKVNEDEELKQKVNGYKQKHQSLISENKKDMDAADKDIEATKEKAKQANAAATADPTNTLKRDVARVANDKLDEAQKKKDDIKYKTDNGNISQTEVTDAVTAHTEAQSIATGATTSKVNADLALIAAQAAAASATALAIANPTNILFANKAMAADEAVKKADEAVKKAADSEIEAIDKLTKASTTLADTQTREAAALAGGGHGNSIKDYEKTLIPDAEDTLNQESRRRTTNYANNTARWWGSNANKEAQNKIIMESKIESDSKN